jgi:hypothetical protein
MIIQHWDCEGSEVDGITLSPNERALRKDIAGKLSPDEEMKEEKKLTGDVAREGGTEPGLRRRLVDELDISGLW